LKIVVVVVPMADGGEVEKLSHNLSGMPWNFENNFKDFLFHDRVQWLGYLIVTLLNLCVP
jgi:hypothetical protein